MLRKFHTSTTTGVAFRSPFAVALLFVLATTLGCLNSKRTDRAFTNDWLEDYRVRTEFEKRKARLRPGEELILAGEEDAARASVYMDEESGRPKLNLGIPEGISADVDIDTDEADVKLKYKFEWGKKKLDIKDTAPTAPKATDSPVEEKSTPE